MVLEEALRRLERLKESQEAASNIWYVGKMHFAPVMSFEALLDPQTIVR